MLPSLRHATAVYVAKEPVDFRKSIDGLALWVETSLPVSPLSGKNGGKNGVTL